LIEYPKMKIPTRNVVASATRMARRRALALIRRGNLVGGFNVIRLDNHDRESRAEAHVIDVYQGDGVVVEKADFSKF
jgi:hypothetical protein